MFDGPRVRIEHCHNEHDTPADLAPAAAPARTDAAYAPPAQGELGRQARPLDLGCSGALTTRTGHFCIDGGSGHRRAADTAGRWAACRTGAGSSFVSDGCPHSAQTFAAPRLLMFPRALRHPRNSKSAHQLIQTSEGGILSLSPG